MTFDAYLDYFQQILNAKTDELPEFYQNPEIIEYTKLNQVRVNRWVKTGQLLPEAIEKIKSISQAQQWIVITEPWCGDASHIVPFIELLARENDLIKVDYELRDSEPHRINQYLTGGAKSIPVLVIQDANGNDIGVFGPRPSACQEFFMAEKAKNASMDHLKVQLQKWYNEDKGVQIQKEIIAKL